MTTVSLDEVRMRLHSLLRAEHISDQHASIIEDHYLGNEVLGRSSHGIFRLPVVIENIRAEGAGGELKLISEVDQSLKFDGDRLPGVVAATLAVDAVIERMSCKTVVTAGLANYQFGTGVMGRYAHRFAEAGLIGIVMANSYALVAPPGGRQPVTGTNPIAIGIPSTSAPIVVDVSTAATAYGKLRVAAAEGSEVGEGLIVDKYGRPSTNPADVEEGAQLALGDAKGFGLGLAVEILAGALIGGDTGPVATKSRNDGTFMISIKPESFGASGFAGQVNDLCELIVGGEFREGSNGIRMPGSNYTRLRSWPETIEVPAQIWAAFLAI